MLACLVLPMLHLEDPFILYDLGELFEVLDVHHGNLEENLHWVIIE